MSEGHRRFWWTVLCCLAGLHLMGVAVLMVWAGQADDSPGLGGLGLINGLVGLVVFVRAVLGQRRGGRH